MYAFGLVFASVALEIEVARHREQAFRKYLESLPEHMRADAIKQHEKERLERIAERRHQELCDAIRSSRLHGIGIFW